MRAWRLVPDPETRTTIPVRLGGSGRRSHAGDDTGPAPVTDPRPTRRPPRGHRSQARSAPVGSLVSGGASSGPRPGTSDAPMPSSTSSATVSIPAGAPMSDSRAMPSEPPPSTSSSPMRPAATRTAVARDGELGAFGRQPRHRAQRPPADEGADRDRQRTTTRQRCPGRLQAAAAPRTPGPSAAARCGCRSTSPRPPPPPRTPCPR